jgi:hypothetical protein
VFCAEERALEIFFAMFVKLFEVLGLHLWQTATRLQLSASLLLFPSSRLLATTLNLSFSAQVRAQNTGQCRKLLPILQHCHSYSWESI